jgi:hypothetical protein
MPLQFYFFNNGPPIAYENQQNHLFWLSRNKQVEKNFWSNFHLFFLKVALDIEYHHNMLLSHQKVNPKEVIVGW